MAASTSRLTPLTRSDSTSASSSSSPYESQYTTYSSRMAGLSRSSSISSTSSAFSRRGSMSAAAASQEPVIRNGFVIPKITLTPPDEKPQRSEPLPWQDYTSKSALYVPVKTEDIGWEEGGLWWHGKFEYREVSLYGGIDDHIVGKYRGGPEGYAYTEIWDQQGFDYQPPRKNHEPAPQKPSPSRSRSKASSSSDLNTSSPHASSSKRSSSGRGSIDTSAESSKRPSASNPASFASASKEESSRREEDALEDKVTGSGSASSKLGASASAPLHTTAFGPQASLPLSLSSSRRNSEASSTFSSTSSSRRTSDSSYGDADTAATSPCDSPLQRSAYSTLLECEDAQMLDSPIEGAAPFDKLEQALLALKAEKARVAAVPGSEDAIADTIPTHDVNAKMRLQPGQSLTLSQDGPSASHRWPKGRGVAKLAERPLTPPGRRPSVPMLAEEDLGYSC